MQITFHHVRQDAGQIYSYFFKPERPVAYTAGQFIELTLPHDEPDGRGIRRWFTLSSSPTQELVSITTRVISEKGSSFKQALSSLKPGDAVTISDPMGDFVLPKQVATPLIFVAAGIGITPFLSMLQWLRDTKESRPIKLIQSLSTEDDIAFQDIFDDAKQHATIVVSQPTSAWGGERGHINAEMILGIESPSEDSLVYVSGPEAMVEKLTEELQAAGLRQSQIVGDYFPGYPSE